MTSRADRSTAATSSGETRGRGTVDRYPWAITLVSCVLAAVAIDLGGVHAMHDADSFLPVLVSLQHWEPFYWQQDRLGMLLPLLARPVTDPFANLLLQSGAGILAALLVFFLLPRFAHVTHAWISGLLAAGMFLAFCPAQLRFDFLMHHQPYATSMALGVGGLVLYERGRGARRAVGVASVLLAHWVNVAAGLVLMPLVIARGVLERAPRALVRDGTIVLLGAVVGWLLMHLSPVHPTATGPLPLRAWPEAWRMLASNARMEAGAWLAVSAAVGGAGLITGACLRRPAIFYRAPAILLVAAAGFASVVSVLEWTKLNLYHIRYLLPALVLATTAMAALVADLLPDPAPNLRRLAPVAIPVVLVGLAVAAYGPPSLRTVRDDVARRANAGWAEEILAAGCTHVAGDYWRVWPAVFYGTLLMRERGDHDVWGLTYRGESTRRCWRKVPRRQLRVCAAPSDAEATTWLARFGLGNMVPVADAPALRVFAVPPRHTAR